MHDYVFGKPRNPEDPGSLYDRELGPIGDAIEQRLSSVDFSAAEPSFRSVVFLALFRWHTESLEEFRRRICEAPRSAGRPKLQLPFCEIAVAQVQLERTLSPGLSEHRYSELASEALGAPGRCGQRPRRESGGIAADHVKRAVQRHSDAIRHTGVTRPDVWPLLDDEDLDRVEIILRRSLWLLNDVTAFWANRPASKKPERFRQMKPRPDPLNGPAPSRIEQAS